MGAYYIGGKIMRRRNERPKKKKGCLSWVGLSALVFVGLGLAGAFDDDGTESANFSDSAQVEDLSANEESVSIEESIKEEESIQQAEEPTQFDNPIEQAANDVWKNNLTDIMIVEGVDGVGRVNISAQMQDNLSGSWIISAFESRILDFAERVQDEDFESIYIMGYFDMVDTYGNVDNRKVYDIELTKDTIAQINFDNFQQENLSSVANQYSVHNAFQ